jgi:hypothetical protein
LKLPDLERSKSAVLNSLTPQSSQRIAIPEIVECGKTEKWLNWAIGPQLEYSLDTACATR